MNFKQFLIETAEWVIEIEKDGVPYFANVESDGRISFMRASPTSFSHCSKWRNKDRALRVLSKIPGATLVPTYGGYTYSSKSSVAPLPEIRKRK